MTIILRIVATAIFTLLFAFAAKEIGFQLTVFIGIGAIMAEQMMRDLD